LLREVNMSKDLYYANDARQRLKSGLDKLAKTVAVTMGPQGKNVILKKFVGAPVITKDGVSVAREITLLDPVEDLACQLVKEAAGRTADMAGDGTTTATVLAREIFERGDTLISTGYSPLKLKRGLEWARDEIVKNLDLLTTKIEDIDSLRNIATISANNDSDMGSAIAEAFEKVGLEGTVLAEGSAGTRTYVRVTEGLEYKKGYITSNFLLDGKSDVVFENARILIANQEIASLNGFLPLLNELSNSQAPLLIICKALKQEALATLVANNKLGRLQCVATEIPPFAGQHQNEWLDDLSILTGAKVFGSANGIELSAASLSDLGHAKRISVNKYVTNIVEGKKDIKRLEHKLAFYAHDIKENLGDTERLDLRKRIEFLQNKTAVICVGYLTELELREKGDRLEDALSAAKAAIDEGFVPGGGTALVRAVRMIDKSKIPEDFKEAAEVLMESCKKPLMQISLNAHQDAEQILKQTIETEDWRIGFNAATMKWENLIESGVIDPKKVTRTALENSTSIALLLINTEAIVSDSPVNKSDWQAPAGWRPPENANLNHKY